MKIYTGCVWWCVQHYAPVALPLQKYLLVHTGLEAGWAPELVWMSWQGQIFGVSCDKYAQAVRWNTNKKAGPTIASAWLRPQVPTGSGPTMSTGSEQVYIYIGDIWGIQSHQMGAEMVPETSVSFHNQLTSLIAREDFTEFSRHENFKLCKSNIIRTDISPSSWAPKKHPCPWHRPSSSQPPTLDWATTAHN
jgi:hypothetical protein